MTTTGDSTVTALRLEDWRRLLDGEQLPLAVLDLDAVDRNAERIAEHVRQAGAGTAVRVATEPLRVPRVTRRILEKGKPFAGVMCFSAAEAELLASRGHDNIVLGYPTVQSKDLDTFVKLHEQDKNVRVVVDSREGIDVWGRAVAGLKAPLAVMIEVDVSPARLRAGRQGGGGRSGLREPADVVALVEAVRAQPDLRFGGVLAHGSCSFDAEPAPSTGMMSSVMRGLDRRRARTRRRALADALRAHGVDVPLFNGGAAGSLVQSDEPWLTERTVGTAFLHPYGPEQGSGLGLEPALFVALQAVRRPAPDRIACHGGGWAMVPHVPRGLELVPADAQGSMQTSVRGPATGQVRLGDPVLFVPSSPGEVAEGFEEILLLSAGAISDRAPTYRGLGCCFP